MTQCDTILLAMLENRDKQWWSAKDFQSGKYFVGYEASPRISELANKYNDLIITAKDGRFRIVSINWDSKDLENELKRLNLK